MGIYGTIVKVDKTGKSARIRDVRPMVRANIYQVVKKFKNVIALKIPGKMVKKTKVDCHWTYGYHTWEDCDFRHDVLIGWIGPPKNVMFLDN